MQPGNKIWTRVSGILREGSDLIVVTVTGCRGSVPCVLGGKALITADGLVEGTVGGGKVEAMVTAEATAMLAGGERCFSRKWNLQRDIGMTCGGEMELLFEKVEAGSGWHIVIFGAGHVSQALIPVLAAMNCRIDVVEERREWLSRTIDLPNVSKHLVSKFEGGVDLVEKNSMVVSITKGHTSDRPVLRDILRKFPDIPFLGVIGSAAKRAVLTRELREDGISEDSLDGIVCPLGIPIGGNDPAEIAVSIAAQLLERKAGYPADR